MTKETTSRQDLRRTYPDAGLVEPKGEFRSVAFDIVRENFRRIR